MARGANRASLGERLYGVANGVEHAVLANYVEHTPATPELQDRRMDAREHQPDAARSELLSPPV